MLTQRRLKDLLDYNPETGIFTWKVFRNYNAIVGDVAGHVGRLGYICISIDYKIQKGHRLAFLYMEGEFPSNHVDHINEIKDDNRWCNIRHATKRQNHYNVGVRSDNSSGAKGVSLHKSTNKWQVRSSHNGNRIYLGLFDSKNEAIICYNNYVTKNHGEFANLNKLDGER